MNITYFPFKPFHIEPNKINVLDLGNSKMYTDFYRGLTDQADVIHVSNDDFETKTVVSQCSWYGDLMLSVNLDRLFLKKIQQRLIDLMADEEKVALIDHGREVVSKVTDASFLMNLPLEVTDIPDIEKIMKFVGLHFSADLPKEPAAILETLIRTHAELGIKKAVVLTNVNHYLTTIELMKLSQLIRELCVTVIVIEYSETNRVENFQDACYYYIDEDLVDWRDMS